MDHIGGARATISAGEATLWPGCPEDGSAAGPRPQGLQLESRGLLLPERVATLSCCLCESLPVYPCFLSCS